MHVIENTFDFYLRHNGDNYFLQALVGEELMFRSGEEKKLGRLVTGSIRVLVKDPLQKKHINFHFKGILQKSYPVDLPELYYTVDSSDIEEALFKQYIAPGFTGKYYSGYMKIEHEYVEGYGDTYTFVFDFPKESDEYKLFTHHARLLTLIHYPKTNSYEFKECGEVGFEDQNNFVGYRTTANIFIKRNAEGTMEGYDWYRVMEAMYRIQKTFDDDKELHRVFKHALKKLFKEHPDTERDAIFQRDIHTYRITHTPQYKHGPKVWMEFVNTWSRRK